MDFPFGEFFGGMGGGRGREDSDEEPEEKNALYKTLGVSPGATQREITRAYRKMATKCHPDRGGDEEKFKEIQEAYEILNDERKRAKYDRYGMRGLKGGGGGGSFFEHMFEGSNRGRRKRSRNPLLKKNMWITLADVCRGPSTKLEVEYLTADHGGVCRSCDGSGSMLEAVRRGNMVLQHQIMCKQCEGQGVSYRNKRYEKKKIPVNIPKGCVNGQKLTLDGYGHQLPENGKKQVTGDVQVLVRVCHHPLFKRVGADLIYKKSLTLDEAICGFDMEIEHPDGMTTLRYSDTGGIRQGQIKVFKGWGVPQLGGHLGMSGNLIVEFDVRFPKSGQITEDIAKQLKNIFDDGKIQWEKLKKRPSQHNSIMEGSRVRLAGLKNYPNLNNRIGTVIHRTERGWALSIDGDRNKLVSVPLANLRLVEEKETKQKRKTTTQMQKENDYEEEVEGIWATEDTIEITPAKAEGGAYDAEEKKEYQRQGGDCQQQ